MSTQAGRVHTGRQSAHGQAERTQAGRVRTGRQSAHRLAECARAGGLHTGRHSAHSQKVHTGKQSTHRQAQRTQVEGCAPALWQAASPAPWPGCWSRLPCWRPPPAARCAPARHRSDATCSLRHTSKVGQRGLSIRPKEAFKRAKEALLNLFWTICWNPLHTTLDILDGYEDAHHKQLVLLVSICPPLPHRLLQVHFRPAKSSLLCLR
eukprot:1146100-Pelagomonas_calceolata.AAC.1